MFCALITEVGVDTNVYIPDALELSSNNKSGIQYCRSKVNMQPVTITEQDVPGSATGANTADVICGLDCAWEKLPRSARTMLPRMLELAAFAKILSVCERKTADATSNKEASRMACVAALALLRRLRVVCNGPDCVGCFLETCCDFL